MRFLFLCQESAPSTQLPRRNLAEPQRTKMLMSSSLVDVQTYKLELYVSIWPYCNLLWRISMTFSRMFNLKTFNISSLSDTKNNRESKILSQLFQAFEYAGGPVPVFIAGKRFSARPSARNRAHSRERPQAAAACRREITCSPSWHDSSIIFLQSNISSLSFAFPFVPSSTENPSIPHTSTASSEASKCHWHAFHDNFASAERPRRASWVARWTCNNDGVALLPGASCGRWHGWMDVTLSSCSPECQEVAMHFSTCWMYISLVWLQGIQGFWIRLYAHLYARPLFALSTPQTKAVVHSSPHCLDSTSSCKGLHGGCLGHRMLNMPRRLTAFLFQMNLYLHLPKKNAMW